MAPLPNPEDGHSSSPVRPHISSILAGATRGVAPPTPPFTRTRGEERIAFAARLSHERGAPQAQETAPNHFTRLRYLPSRVSTMTRSPGPMNGGTWIFNPVSSVAGLYCAA